MTKEEKDLLLKDLSARIPYEVQMRCFDPEVDDDNSYTGNKIGSDQTLFGINLLNIETEYTESIPIICVDEDGQEGCYSLDNIKPYLRPLSIMTEDESKRLNDIKMCPRTSSISNFSLHSDIINFLLINHFDYNGLIPKGLALRAPEDMYKTK